MLLSGIKRDLYTIYLPDGSRQFLHHESAFLRGYPPGPPVKDDVLIGAGAEISPGADISWAYESPHAHGLENAPADGELERIVAEQG